MELHNALQTRRSIRQFEERPVPETVLLDLLDKARWSPSSHNCQPWELAVVGGNCLKQIAKEYREVFLSKLAPTTAMRLTETYPDHLFARYRQVGAKALAAVDIDPSDKIAREAYTARMFSFFDVPAMVYVMLDKQLEKDYPLVDVGLFTQTFCLLATEAGLGTCIMAMAAFYPDILEKHLPLVKEKTVVLGIGVGYPVMDAPLNCFERERAPLSELLVEVKMD